MAANTGTVKIRFDIDDQGSVKITQLGKKSKEAGGQVEESFRRGGRSISDFNDRAGKSVDTLARMAGAVLGMVGLGKISASFLDIAASFEQMGMKLDALTRGRGSQTLKELNDWALKMPGDTRKIVDTFAMMMAMGLDPTIDKMKILVDVSTLFGEEAMPRVARALGQMATLGELSQEELNQMSEAGINAAKYLREAFGMTVEQLQKSGTDINQIIETIWRGLNAEFGGSSELAMKTWNGLWETFKSSLVEIEREIMDAGIFDGLKEGLRSANETLDALLKNRSAIREFSHAVMTTADLLGHLGKVAGVVFGVMLAPAVIKGVVAAFGWFQNSIFNLHAGMGLLSSATLALKSSFAVLMAAFAGWEIGKWLSDNFEEARLAGILFVAGLMEGWLHLKYGAQVALEGIKEAFRIAFGGIKDLWIGTLGLIAKGASHVPFMGQFSEALAYSVSQLKAARTESTAYADAVNRLSLKKTEEMGVHVQIVGAMLEEAFVHEKLEVAAKKSGEAGKKSGHDTADGASAATEALKEQKRLQDLVERYELKKIADMPVIGDDYEGITEAIQSWPDTYREIDEEAAEAAEKTKKLAEEAERAAKAFAELSGETFGEAFLSGITDGFDGVWDSLRSKLTDIGADLIGKQIGDAISKPISQALTNTFKGMSKGLADSIGVAGSGVMGGLMAAGISTIVDSVFGGGENKYAAVYEAQRKLAEEIRKNTEATRENTHFKRSGETSSYSSGFFNLRTAADEARQTLRDQMRDLKSPLGSVFDVDIGEMVDTVTGLNAFIKSLDGMTIDTGGWADALAQFQGLADILRVTGKDVPVGVESIIATLEAFSADLDGVQKEIIASARDMWEGAGDAFRTEAEKQKREVERSGKDLLMGLAESFKLEGALPGGDYISSLANMASVQEISGRILSDLIPGTEAYNQVMETTLLIYETARLQERKRAEETVAIYDGLNSYMKDLRGETTDLDRAIRSVNAQFDEWEAQLKDAGATETDLSNERAEAIEITRKLAQETGVLTDEMAKQAEALEKSLADAVTRLSLSGKALEEYAVNQEYQGYVDQIKALGEGYKDLIQKADEWRAISLSAIEEQIASGRAGVFSDMDLYLKDLRGELSDVDKALIDVNSRFDDYEAKLKELSGEEVSLSAEREEAIRLTRKLHEESAALADSLVDLSSAMSSVKGMWSSAMDPYMPDRDREVKAFERAGKEALQSLATAYGMVNINWNQSVETLAGTVLSLSQGTAAFDAALEMTSLLRQTAAAQERKQAETTADLYSDLDLYLRGLRGGLTDVDREVMEVNKRFDDYEAQILNATGAEVSLATERAEAIALTKKLTQETGSLSDEMAKQAQAIQESLTDSILRIALPDDLFNRYRIDQEYQEYIDQIKELGSGYSSLITKAKEWRKLSLDTLTKQAQAEEARNKAAEYQNQADAWGSAADSVSSFLNDLKYGESSTLSTAEKMAEIQKELKSIRPSTTEDITRAQELWKTYLSLGKERFQLPSSEWRAIMADATAELYDLREYAADKETELLNLTREQNQILMNVEQWTKALATRTAAAYDLPGYATGLDYVPSTMPVIVHPREAILNATDAETWRRGQTEKGGDVITVNFTVNGAARPEDTARLARMEIESYLNGRGRRRLQAAAMGR